MVSKGVFGTSQIFKIFLTLVIAKGKKLACEFSKLPKNVYI